MNKNNIENFRYNCPRKFPFRTSIPSHKSSNYKYCYKKPECTVMLEGSDNRYAKGTCTRKQWKAVKAPNNYYPINKEGCPDE